MRSLAAYVLLCLLMRAAGAWLRDKLNAMKRLIPLLPLLLVGTAQAQPTSLVEATDTTWSEHGLQVHVSGTDTAWVYEGARDTLWHARWNGRTLVDCGRMGPVFDVEELASDARDVLRHRGGNGINDPFMTKAECITTFAAIRR